MYLLPKQQMFALENREAKRTKPKPFQIHLTRGVSLVQHIAWDQTRNSIYYLISEENWL